MISPLLLLGLVTSAYASGAIELGSISYLRTSADRPMSGNTLNIRPDFQWSNETLEARVQLDGIGYMNALHSFTGDVPNLFLGTSREWSSLHQLTLGRRQYHWSVADDYWALGTWSPRFMWDTLRPRGVGLTGVFYQYQSRLWSMRLFASPVSIPERGAPIRTENGKLASTDPDWPLLYDRVDLGPSMGNENVPIQYGINYPPISDLVLHPSALLKLRFGEQETGLWSSIAAGIKPINPIDITVETSLRLQPVQYVDAQVYPRVIYHRLGTFETGFRNKIWSIWGSISREEPISSKLAEGRSSNPVGPAWINSTGLAFSGLKNTTLSSSVLHINETAPPAAKDDIPLVLPSRFRFRRAAAFRTEWSPSWRITNSLNLTRDLQERNQWFAADTSYRFGKGQWQIGLGADLFVSGSRHGMLGPYAGNDRVRGRMVYEF